MTERYNPNQSEVSWDDKFERGWGEGSDINERMMEFLGTHSEELPKGSKVLDIGCGNGNNLVPLAEAGFDVTGVDISGTGLQKVQERLDAKDLGARLIKGESNKLAEIDDDSQDLAISFGVIHHNRWEGIRESFAEAQRVLKPGNYFLFSGRSTKDDGVPKEQISDHGFTAIDTEGDKKDVIQHYFTEEELVELANDNNFEIVENPEETVHPRKENPNRIRGRWYVIYRKKENKEMNKKLED